MPEINLEEYGVLKELDDKYKWIARDDNNMLWVYAQKPQKETGGTWQISGICATKVNNIDLFQFIQWENPKPYNIAELIKEYGYHNEPIDKLADFIMSEVEGEPSQNQGAVDTAIRIIKSYQNQETLSEEWLEENKCSWYKLKVDGYYISVEKLQNLLVPEQELPVIPQYIAEAIEEDKECGCDVYDSIYFIIETNGGGLPSISDWVAKNIDKYARAWLDGYTLEEEQKYIVSDNSSIPLLIKNDDGKVMAYDSQIAYNNANGTIELTEQEIKDYDPRYMTFAKPVEDD